MKKAILTVFAFMAVFMMPFAAHAAGERILYYDVAAYINNHPIPCYNINDYCGIYVRDLRSYGFNVDYDDQSRVVNVTRNKECTDITGIEGVKLPWQESGTLYEVTEESDIKVLLDGVETPSYSVNDSMMILLDNLYPYGSKLWAADIKALFLTMDDLPVIEYAPLEKAARPYGHYKPASSELDYNSYYNFPTEEVDWGFTRVEGDEPELYSWQKSMLAKFDAYYIDHDRPHAIYLTFDEGYEAGYTQKILDVLSKYNVPATFFVTGEYLDESSDLVRQMIDKGFTVGNHTVNHKNLAQCDVGTIMNEIEVISNRLRDEFGYDVYYMRPPEGAINERALAIAKDMGYNTILWSFAYYDYDESVQKGEDYAYDMITRYMHDGAIYLLHAVSRDNANALERVIQYAIANGHELRSLNDLCKP